MRTYQQTHPWINFSLDMKNLSYKTWLLLGEAASKIEHIAGVPLDPRSAEKLHGVYLTKGVLATVAIEGNTLTEPEVKEYLEGSLKLPPSKEYLGTEIENVIKAVNKISNELCSTDPADVPIISIEEICEYNRIVLTGLPVAPEVVPGEMRSHSVLVGRYRGAPAEDLHFLLDRFCTWLNSINPPEAQRAPISILTAIAAHLYFVWIQPFADGNGRTARLIEFRYLLQAGFPTPAAHLLSNFYNSTRTMYYRMLDHAGQSKGDMVDFIDYAVQGFVDQLKEQLNEIREMQWETTWENHVYKQFSKYRPSETTNRRRALVLELSKAASSGGWIPRNSIPDLSVKLARYYNDRTDKTLSRDLNHILSMNLIQQKGRMVRADREVILAFLPQRMSASLSV